MRNHPTQNSEQNVLNEVFDRTLKALVTESAEYDGVGLITPPSSQVALKVVEASGYTYVCIAPIGTAQSAALWQCKRIDSTVGGTTVITWADGNNDFDNVATNPASLSYS